MTTNDDGRVERMSEIGDIYDKLTEQSEQESAEQAVEGEQGAPEQEAVSPDPEDLQDSQDGEATDDEEPLSDPEENPDTDDGDAEEEEPHPDEDAGELQPVEHWSAEDKAVFNSEETPVAVKKWMLRRHEQMERGFTRKTQQLEEQRKQYQPLMEVSQRHGEYFQRLGVSDAQALDVLVSAERILREGSPEQKLGKFAQLAQDYGVDLRQLNPDGHGDGQDGYNDPRYAQIQGELQSVKLSLQQREQAEQQRQEASLQQKVQSFAEAKDESGILKHPHFEEVRGDMARLANEYPDWTLDQMYQKAVRLNDDVFEKVQKEEKARQEALEKERKSKAAAKAKKVQRAMVKTKSQPSSKPKKALSLKDEIGTVWDELAASA